MKIGYVRVSTAEQNTVRQDVLMEQLGVEKVYTDKMSGKDRKRPALNEMLAFVRDGDIVIVESFSRLARSTRDLLDIVEKLKNKNVELISKKEAFDTTTPQGKFAVTIFGAVAELEREQILQRQREGIDAAKAAGKYTGRKRIEVDEKTFAEQYRMWKNGETAPRFICRRLGISNATFYRRVAEYEEKIGIKKENE